MKHNLTRAQKMQMKYLKRKITDDQLKQMVSGLLFMSKWELLDGRMLFPNGFKTKL